MQIKWLEYAVLDLQELYQYISYDSAQAAKRVTKRIQKAVNMLAEQPYIGRAGRVHGTRELIITGTPYIVPYRVKIDKLEILRVLHGAMQWPDSFKG
jgi:toxin ParE1/3/4